MKNLSRSLLVLALALPFGCGSSDPAPTQSPAGEATPTSGEAPSQTSGPAPGAGPAAGTPIADGDVVPFEVESQETHEAPGAPPGASLAVTSSNGEVIVRVQSFSYYCSPSPSFTATRVGGTLRLTLSQPENPTRCLSVYDMDLSFGVIDQGAWLEHVVIVRPDGAEAVAGDVARTR